MSQEAYPGQNYVHKHNPNIKATEERASQEFLQDHERQLSDNLKARREWRRIQDMPIFNGSQPQSWYDRNYKSLMLISMVLELLGLGFIAFMEFLSYYFPRHP